MQGDQGVAFSKPDQLILGARRFGDLHLNDFHDFIAKRQVLNVQRFKVHGASAFPLLMDFTQQIGHAIAYHHTACHVRVRVQRSRGVAHHRTKRHIQVGETPTTTHTQL